MKTKQVSIQMECVPLEKTTQHHGGVGEGYTSNTEVVGYRYTVTKIRNAATIEWDKKLTLRIGTDLTEEQAEAIARCKTFDVTITN